MCPSLAGLGVLLGGYTAVLRSSLIFSDYVIDASCYTVRAPQECIILKLKEIAEGGGNKAASSSNGTGPRHNKVRRKTVFCSLSLSLN